VLLYVRRVYLLKSFFSLNSLKLETEEEMEIIDRTKISEDTRQELSSSLNRYIETITQEASDWAEQARKEAMEQAELEARHVIARAEEEAKTIVEKTRNEAVAAARKEAEFVKHQAKIQIEEWLKEMRESMLLQLRGIAGILRKEMLTQSETLKRRASLFEMDFEQQLSELLKKELTIEEASLASIESTTAESSTQEPLEPISEADIPAEKSKSDLDRPASEISLTWQ
jgi:hypothetical protein